MFKLQKSSFYPKKPTDLYRVELATPWCGMMDPPLAWNGRKARGVGIVTNLPPDDRVSSPYSHKKERHMHLVHGAIYIPNSGCVMKCISYKKLAQFNHILFLIWFNYHYEREITMSIFLIWFLCQNKSQNKHVI